ncbi:DUF7507 domain-containing protein [Myroides sp. LJL115]
MKRNYIKQTLLLAVVFLSALGAQAQGAESFCISGCNDNTFIQSHDPNTIEYDNMVSGFHSTILREADGTVKVWGQGADASGNTVTTPLIVSPENGFNYEGEILKITLGSQQGQTDKEQQFAILTTEGLYIWGGTNMLVHSLVKPTRSFGKVGAVNLKRNKYGLPIGVNPQDVKMLFGSYKTLGIVTCDGNAWMMSTMGNKNGQAVRPADSNTEGWTQVKTGENQNLNNVVAMRGSANAMMALTSTGEVYTWGSSIYLGNNTDRRNETYATKMTLPANVKVKMIGVTYGKRNSYFILSTNGELYSLGANDFRELGDFTTQERKSWVRVKLSKKNTGNDSDIDKIAWFSPSEHSHQGTATVSALTVDGKLWSWGSNSGQMIGGSNTSGGVSDPIYMGRGLGDDDTLIALETGGHTTMVVRECSFKYGYIGHRINGSMGDGTTVTGNEREFNFQNTSEINLCGAPTAPVVKSLLKMCQGTTMHLDQARIEGVQLNGELKWFEDAQATIELKDISKVGPGEYYVAYAENTCEKVPAAKVVVKYYDKDDVEFQDCNPADLYTEITYSINQRDNASIGSVGEQIIYKVKAGNYGPSNVQGATFTFTVPVGVEIINPENISFTTSCANGTVSESVALTYDSATRTFSSELNLPDGCSIIYTFTGTLSGLMGTKIAESTILRPNGVFDQDATNKFDEAPTNPHYECYNHPGSGDAFSCNNNQEVSFTLTESCIAELLYFEDFGRNTWAVNSGRTDWSNKQSYSIVGNIFADTRNGKHGGATSSYLFAPGIADTRYQGANNSSLGHSDAISVARIKNGYYSVNPPSYVQMGIPQSDLWHEGLWQADAPTNDPNIANSNYDWTPAWDNEKAIRDVSGAVNGSAFLVRGATSRTQSVKPFYEFEVPGTVEDKQIYTLSLYSYVTYHNKDYMLMDVIDVESGHIYATVPLTYPGKQLPPGASPEGFSLGWVPLQASVKFTDDGCETSIVGKRIKVAIRGSHNRALSTGKGFGHTLIDDISFTKRSNSSECTLDAVDVNCQDACYTQIRGKGYKWVYPLGALPPSPVTQTFTQPATDGGFTMDIYYLDNSFNMEINGVMLSDIELEFEDGVTNSKPNVRFKSDGSIWKEQNENIWVINREEEIDFDDIHSNTTPVIRVQIDRWGNAKLFGIKKTGAALEELEVFDGYNPTELKPLNRVMWNDGTTDELENTIVVKQNVVNATAMTVYGYGMNIKECETCTLEKTGEFNDEDGDGFARVGETITYTFQVKNSGDMDITDIEIVDPLFGFNIKLDPDTNKPTLDHVTMSGDINGNGVLNRSETWEFTVSYPVTEKQIFQDKGVYNRARVTGVGILPNTEIVIDEKSVDPNFKDGDPNKEEGFKFHTFVPLKGSTILITNPMIYQRMK